MGNKNETFIEQACYYLALINAGVTVLALICLFALFEISTYTVIMAIMLIFTGAVVCVILFALYEILHYINAKKTKQ